MNHNVKRLSILVSLMVVVVICLTLLSPLARFSRRIANADHIVVAMVHSPVNLTITGEDIGRISHAVSSAERETMGDSCRYDVTLTFFKNTNVLGNILTCTSLFYTDGKKYNDKTGLIAKLAVDPIRQKYTEWEQKQLESK